jgi:hypothetical protein
VSRARSDQVRCSAGHQSDPFSTGRQDALLEAPLEGSGERSAIERSAIERSAIERSVIEHRTVEHVPSNPASVLQPSPSGSGSQMNEIFRIPSHVVPIEH